MFCEKCSVEKAPGAKFCSQCGQAFNRKRTIRPYILIALLVIAVGVVAGMIKSASANIEENQFTESDKPELIREARSKVFTILTDDGQGSGFLYDEKGHVLTSGHVVVGYTEVKVKNQMGQELKGKVIGIDDYFDMAVLEVEEMKGEKPLEIGMYRLPVGSEIISFGTPLGLENTAAVGYVTADQQGAYQMDVQMASGSSGGPVMDVKTGKVIAINTAMYNDEIPVPFANPLQTIVSLVEKWINAPMTPEEIQKVEFPEEEWDEGEVEKPVLDEFTVSNYIHEFRTYEEMAVNYGEFFYIEDSLMPDSQAYKYLKKEFSPLIQEEAQMKLISTTVDDVSIKGNQATATTNEVSEIIRSGNSERVEKKFHYTFSVDEYGFFVISEMKEL